jgi:hypothetical protein
MWKSVWGLFRLEVLAKVGSVENMFPVFSMCFWLKGVFVPVFACAASLPKDWDLFWDDVLHKQPSSIKLLRETEDLLFEQVKFLLVFFFSF